MYMRLIRFLCFALATLFLSACATTGVTVGGGQETPVAGSSEAVQTKQLNRCDGPRGTAILELSSEQNAKVFTIAKLPPNPLPAMRLIVQQSKCLTLVYRTRTMEQERRLEASGELKEGSQFGSKQLVAADYTLLVEVTISSKNTSGGGIGGLVGTIGGLFGPAGLVAGAVAGSVDVSTSEANVLLTLIDNRTGVQVVSSAGQASGTDWSFGGGGFGLGVGGGLGALGAGGYEKTDQGKVVMGAMIDGMNKLAPSIPLKP
jgi:hypothetical protein